MDISTFKEKANNKHENFYDYSLITETNITHKDKVRIICPLHGEFTQNVNSHLCRSGCPECGKDKKKQTCIDRYGTEHPAKTKIIKEKTAQTCMDRYGTKCYSLTSEFIEKSKNTCRENYGVDNPSQSEEVKEKKKQTYIERYNTVHPWSNKKIRQQIKCTMNKEYGVDNPSQSSIINQKRKQTFINRFGVDNPGKHEQFIIKAQQTNKQRYNRLHKNQEHISDKVLNLLNDKDWIVNQHVTQQKTLTQIANELNVGITTVQRYLHSHQIKTQHFFKSIGEKELADYIESMGIFIETNVRTLFDGYNLEVDVFLPEFNIAIEYNGDYWHGDNFPHTQEKDILKQKLCEELDVCLIVVKENDWINNNEHVKQELYDLFTSHQNHVIMKLPKLERAND